MRLLMIEDNRELAHAVVDRLQLDGYAVDCAHSLVEARQRLGDTPYDLVLLDIHLPDGDARQLLGRELAQATPVIVLTARSAIADRVNVLDGGADDYITKPVDLAELAARCRAVLRRHGRGTEPVRIGDLELDPAAATVTVGSRSATLRHRELRLLQALARQPGRVYAKAELHDQIYGVLEAVSDNAIEVNVARLRKVLSDSATTRIETVRGVGYRLVDG